MSDFILFIAVMFGTYMCSVAFVAAMVRVFFPFKTQEEWAKIQAAQSAASQFTPRHQRIPKMRRASHGIMEQSRQLA